MDDNVYFTNEKLKSYLNTNQSARERMCLSILALDKNYTEIKPRHPNGGRDNGRDIEALYKDSIICFCGVGFVNDACDSKEQKKEIFSKFNSDLLSAIQNATKESKDLKGFVFFTNIELTIDERSKLEQSAKAKGLEHCEIYYRERMFNVLNSIDGYAIRFNYLGIPLNESEQASFFSKWGDDIQSVISTGFQKMDNSINRMIFLQESLLPLNYLSIRFNLNREYSSNEIGHFRILTFLSLPDIKHLDDTLDLLDIVMILSDDPDRIRQEGFHNNNGIENGFSGYSGFEVYDNKIDSNRFFQMTTSSSIGVTTTKSFVLQYQINDLFRMPPDFSISDFDKAYFMPCISENLCNKLQSIEIYANAYKIYTIGVSDISFKDKDERFKNLPMSFNEDELKTAWKCLFHKEGYTLQLDFSNNTPKRIIGY